MPAIGIKDWESIIEISKLGINYIRTFLTPPLSLTTMTSRGESFLPCQHLRKFRPIRPNPLMATFSFATVCPLIGLLPAAT